MMFRLENNVPDYYVRNSRDFQLLCRLYDLALQPTRYSIRSITTSSDTTNCNESLLPLLGTKVGFFSTYSNTDESLRKIIASFPYIIKNKGTLLSLKYIAHIFSRLTNSNVSVDEHDIHDRKITLLFDTPYKNIELFYELIEYVRPAGFIIEYDVKSVIDTNNDPDGIITTDTLSINNNYRGNVGFTQIEPYTDIFSTEGEEVENTD